MATTSTYNKSKTNERSKYYKPYQKHYAKKVDFSTEKVTQTGDCEGCGKTGSTMRYATRDFICTSCREDIDFKLITKTSALSLYPTLTIHDLIHACKEKMIKIFFVKNWHDRNAPPIKLYYEKEIRELAKQKERFEQSSIRRSKPPPPQRQSEQFQVTKRSNKRSNSKIIEI
jgi:hypothetical protein